MPSARLKSPLLVGLMVSAAFSATGGENRADGIEFFESRIRPVLVERCYPCHSAQSEKLKGSLRLDSRDGVRKGGDNGPVLVPGHPEQSRLIEAIRYQNEDLRMPPPKRGKLNAAQIADFVTWVRMGAPDPRTNQVAGSSGTVAADSPYDFVAARKLWSFRRPQPPPVPRVKNRRWPKSPIDRFILAQLEANHLTPSPQADKRTLIRRATFDLIGLPPTPAEVDDFLDDRSPDAFAKVIDRLLASPHYGERWGRHWLDVVRYTDSFDARGIGGEADVPEAYRYRDWVVEAFNRDLPYDRFVIDQFAGDILATNDPEGFDTNALIATGVMAIGEWGTGDADKEKMMTDIVADQIDVTGRAFLGLTLGCARCHDHKFDPIPTADYYSLAGIFFSSHILPSPGLKTAGSPVLRIPLVPPAEVARHKEYEDHVAELEKQIKVGSTNQPPPSVDVLARWKAELARLKGHPLPPIPVAHGLQEGGVPGSVYAGIHDAPIQIRGSYERLGPVVPRRFPRLLAGDHPAPITAGSGRLQLARWIASPNNPMTARVMVNRIWQHHFGEGIVRTANNFGKLGTPPTHPELLDYLACEFVKSGWSIKAMHRAIMLSATYQQSSIPDDANRRADPDNKLLGRMNRQRLEAEAIRDSLLAAAGDLDPSLRGPAIRELDNHRRTLYLMTIRSDRSNYRMLFDAADPVSVAEARLNTTVAPQALFLLNNPFVLDQVKRLAAEAQTACPGQDRTRIGWLYERLYGRPPTTRQTAIGLQALRHARQSAEARGRGIATALAWEAYCQVLVCANEFIYVD